MPVIGLSNEFIEEVVFPWGPALFGEPLGWRAGSLMGFLAGLAHLGGTLELSEAPVVRIPYAIAAMSVGPGAHTAFAHHTFDFLAMPNLAGALLVARCYPRAR